MGLGSREKSCVVGVVLAGGHSLRMGRDKAALPFAGETLLAHNLRALAPLVEGVVVAARPGQLLPQTPAGVEVLRDSTPEQGPLRALADACAACSARADAALLLATDGLAEPRLLQRLLDAYRRTDAEAVVACVGGQLLPLPGVYSTTLKDRAEALLLGPQRGLKHLLAASRCLTLPIDPQEARLLSLDTPEDYQAALAGGGPVPSPS